MKVVAYCPCGRVIITTQKRLEAGRGRYCSRDCMYAHRVRPSGLTYNIIAENQGWFQPGREHAKGPEAHGWKGADVSYQELHRWVRKNKVKPEFCEHCGELKKLEWANKSHEYLRDLDDWLALCKLCHRRYDMDAWGVATARYGNLQGYANR